MKLNCDMGESFGAWRMGEDELVMPLVDQANIACGFHASDPQTMRNTVKLALENNVSIGAHPAYPDTSLALRSRSYPSEAEARKRRLIIAELGAWG